MSLNVFHPELMAINDQKSVFRIQLLMVNFFLFVFLVRKKRFEAIVRSCH